MRLARAAALLAAAIAEAPPAASLNASADLSWPAPFPELGCARVAPPGGDWIFQGGSGRWPSCNMDIRADGATVCLDAAGNQDPTSIFINLKDLQESTGCFAWTSVCNFDLLRVLRIEFDIDLHNCESVWAAPLWITPHPWLVPADTSGEVDFVELCPRGSVATNFGAGGAQGETERSWASAAGLKGPKHFVATFDASSGTLSTQICNQDGSGCFNGAQYNNFLHTVASTRGRTSSFPYNFVVDVWNGYGGDGGWQGCHAQNDANSMCQYAVKNIRVYTRDGSPLFTGKCAAMNGVETVGQLRNVSIVV
eukprot:TRINITY_DN12132_c0_g1_i2.p1 TRINITY_DN12132_c0_g1~~TRINITY_DN12132_c0_g1_i2.p1  ORF type:complete len:317 (+),score=58.97 TRINITY_DN12132_c0_g1_i2:26-952(+)